MRVPSVDALLQEVHEKDEKILKLRQEIRFLRQRLSEESLKLSIAERKLLDASHEALRTARRFAQKELALKEQEKQIRAKTRRDNIRKVCDRQIRCGGNVEGLERVNDNVEGLERVDGCWLESIKNANATTNVNANDVNNANVSVNAKEKKEITENIKIDNITNATNANTTTTTTTTTPCVNSTSFSLSISGNDLCDTESKITAVLEENRRLIELTAEPTPRKKSSPKDNLIEYLDENGIKSMLGLKLDVEGEDG